MQTPRWMRFLLIGSLAFNLLIVGLVVGAYTREGPDLRERNRPGASDYGPYSQALSPEQRDAFRDAVRGQGPKFRDNRRALRESFQTVLTILRAETLDTQALEAALAAQEAALRGRTAIAAEVMIARIEAMSPEDRAAFADRLEETVRRGGRGPRE